MYLTEPVKAKIVEFNFKYPYPTTNDDDSATWTHRLCQQLKYSFPNDGWGHKKADANRPHSADVICLSSPFIGWDIITSAGSPNAKLNLNGESIDLTGQIFEQVTAADFIGSEPPTNPPPSGSVDEKLNLIIAKLDALDKKVDTYHTQEMEAITAPRITRMA
jgi:hypothetical protein